MWIVKRSVLFTPDANTSAQAASERKAVSSTGIRRQNKEFQSARVNPTVVNPTVVNPGEKMPS